MAKRTGSSLGSYSPLPEKFREKTVTTYGTNEERMPCPHDSTDRDSSGINATDESQGSSGMQEEGTKHHCRLSCTYNLSLVRPKGAILVLVWNLLVFSCVNGAYSIVVEGIVDHIPVIPHNYAWTLTVVSIVRVMVWTTYPLAGWLADTYFGRYRTIHFSMWIIWVATVALMIFTLLLYLYPENDRLDTIVCYALYPVVFVVMAIGLCGFQAIVIPFGTDQMPGASAEELATFIRWYFWTKYFGFDTVYTYYLGCEHESDKNRTILIQAGIQAFCMTLAISLNLIFHQWLEFEPGDGNPLTTATGVLKFAKDNKIPRQRSALTYWEDDMPSRIDLAKSKYGGPFTYEQVEDVKTFLRITAVLIACIAPLIGFVAVSNTTGQFLNHILYSPTKTLMCYEATAIANLPIAVITIAVPIYHFLIHPFVRNWIPTSLKRIGFSIALLIGSLIFVLILDVVGHIASHDGEICFLTEENSTDARLKIDYHWLAIPYTVAGLAFAIGGMAMYEFICAQTPHRMKGLLIGLLYSVYGFANVGGFLILLAFYTGFDTHPHFTFPIDIGCGLLYYTVNLGFTVCGFVLFCIVARWYKPRRRDDLGFEPVRVESYYEAS